MHLIDVAAILLYSQWWVESYGWMHKSTLDDNGLFTFEWTVDVKKNVLLFEVSAPTIILILYLTDFI